MSAAQMYQELGLCVPDPPPVATQHPKKRKKKRATNKPIPKKSPPKTAAVIASDVGPDSENIPPCNGKQSPVTSFVAASRQLDAVTSRDIAVTSREGHVTSPAPNESDTRTPPDTPASLESDGGNSFQTNNVTEVEGSLVSSIVPSCAVSRLSCTSYTSPCVATAGTSTNANVKRKRAKLDTSAQDAPTLKKKKKKTNLGGGGGAVKIVDKFVEMGSKQRDGASGKDEARQMFEWLIHPVNTDQFFKELWENKPLLIKRHNSNYNSGWFSSKDFSNILKHNPIQFGTHLDLTSYREGKRETHNLPGRAYPHLVWKHFNNGGSIRMLNPQTYSEQVWLLLNTLQDFFRSTMGANVYLTPPGTQGFAPHYDDIEAFMIQLEGKKHWRLYAPRENECLPINSSPNFTQTDLGKPILDTILEAGDVLYFPRGTIHQGNCLPDSHSLHITVSTYQKNTWGDLLEKLLPKALAIAREEDKEYREGLPLDYLDYTGISKSDIGSPNRSTFIKKVEDLMGRLTSYAPVDSAADDLAAKLIHDSLPPHPDRGSIAQHSTVSVCTNGQTSMTPTITASSRVRLTTPYCARVIAHEECISLQHTCSNTRLFHETDPQEIDYPSDYGPALEMITNTYPHFVEIRALPISSKTGVQLVQELVDMNILQLHSKASNNIISSIRSKVRKSNQAPEKIKGRNRKGSEDEIPIRLRSGEESLTLPARSKRPPKLPARPVSSTWDREPPTRDLHHRKARTLEPMSRTSNTGGPDRRFTYGRSCESNSAMLTEV